jgi:hypothetical protein
MQYRTYLWFTAVETPGDKLCKYKIDRFIRINVFSNFVHCPNCHTASSEPSSRKSKLCYGRRSVGQSVFVSSPHLGPKTRFLLLSHNCWFVEVGRPLWREDRSVAYNWYWPSPKQSFSGPSPAGQVTMFYCLRFEIPPTWRARSPYLYTPGIGWPSYTPRHRVPFSSPPTREAMVEIFEPVSTLATRL